MSIFVILAVIWFLNRSGSDDSEYEDDSDFEGDSDYEL